MLFKEFAGIDAFPICLNTKDPDEIVETVARIAPGFGGINLEDISAPRCFEVEDRLKEILDIPVFHDDQHGTAIVVLAALLNACKLTGRDLMDLNVLVTGLGAAGVAVTKILVEAGVRNIIGADSKGLLSTERADYVDGTMNATKRWYAQMSNPLKLQGTPADAIDGMDLFIGLSGARVMPPEALARMNKDAMVFAMANPTPEVTPEEAAPYVRIMATGRSDYPNQINNVLAFPGIFRGVPRAPQITEPMKMAAALRSPRSWATTGCARTTSSRRVQPDVAPRWPRPSRPGGATGQDHGNTGFAAVDAERIRGDAVAPRPQTRDVHGARALVASFPCR